MESGKSKSQHLGAERIVLRQQELQPGASIIQCTSGLTHREHGHGIVMVGSQVAISSGGMGGRSCIFEAAHHPLANLFQDRSPKPAGFPLLSIQVESHPVPGMLAKAKIAT